ncbi:MAG TPA: hypothetical protein VFE62_00155 [Gemmataceae bacterium]|nr:hypothetical protein [Gemmataceae bacterium]
MSASHPVPRPLPKAFIIAGSVFAVAHLLAVGLFALAANSGPWPTNFGSDTSPGPSFAAHVSNKTEPYYLRPLHLAYHYVPHANSNRPAPFAAYFEVRLKNKDGDVIKDLKFPDEKANFWVRHRQSILAQGLAEDSPLQMGTEVLPKAGGPVPTIEIWEMNEGQLHLVQKEKNLVPRDRPVVRPSEWSKLLAQSYMRYLCKEYGADSAELIRHSRELIMPMDMLVPRPDAFNELQSNFGEYRREQ